MLHLQIDPHSGIPIYRQVMDQVRYYVASGALKPGAQLPSIRELSVALTVNPTTVVKAYSELSHEGVVEMRHGKGVFVAQTPPRLSAEEQTRALERLARQLAVEAAQMGASKELVMKIVADELDRINTPGIPPLPLGEGQSGGELTEGFGDTNESGDTNGRLRDRDE